MMGLQQHATPLRVVIVGHVDHGKSTLIGRLLYDTASLEDGKIEELENTCRRRGTDVMEWSFLLDSFQAERDQAITIDTTQIFFSSEKRNYVIIDAPGHREFLRNMVSGAAQADAAILVVDALEGVKEQTKRHSYLLHLLGLRQIAVVINKMDALNYDQQHFAKISKDIKNYLHSIGIEPTVILPISARNGDMISQRGTNLDWYNGKDLIQTLDQFTSLATLNDKALRFPIQDVYRHGETRILVGRIESGTLSKGDTLFFSPTNETAIIASIESWPDNSNDKIIAKAGESIGITLDQPIFVERGHIASHAQEESLPLLSNVFKANIFWLSEKALKTGDTFKIRYATTEAIVTVQSIDRVIDTQDLHKISDAANVKRNEVAEVTIRARELLAIDPYNDNPIMGRIAIYDGYDIAGGGIISMDGYPNQRQNAPKSKNIYEVDHLLTSDIRAKRNGHTGAIFWFTGLSGAGKSTLAMEVERRLFERGYHTYVMDGDNVRHGLNSDLGFSPEDRAENIRRIGEVAALMANAGLIVVTAFISPYQADRDRARNACPEAFNEIYVKADLATCEARDPKGLYKKARDGQIKQFTGIDSPYEAPSNPEMVVDTQNNDVDTCVEQVISFVQSQVKLKEPNKKTAIA